MTREEYEEACKRIDELTKESIWTLDERQEFNDLYLKVMTYELAKQGDEDVQND